MIVANLYTEDSLRGERSRPRRIVRVDVEAKDGASGVPAIVRNLSETGLLLETRASLAVDDRFEIDLPLAGECTARVMWIDGVNHGCRFESSITKAAVSAAALISPIEGEEAPEASAEDASPDGDPARVDQGNMLDDFFDASLPRPTDKIWYAANVALFLLVVATAIFVIAMLKSAAG